MEVVHFRSAAPVRGVATGDRTDRLPVWGHVSMPEGEGPFPGAVFIHGSGTSSRDNPW